jgi:excisionase family DNA binding protein
MSILLILANERAARPTGLVNRLLTPAEVGDRVGLKRDAIYRAIERGDLQATKLCGRLRVRSEWVDEWINDGRAVPPTTREPSTQPRRPRRRLAGDSVRARLREERAA